MWDISFLCELWPLCSRGLRRRARVLPQRREPSAHAPWAAPEGLLLLLLLPIPVEQPRLSGHLLGRNQDHTVRRSLTPLIPWQLFQTMEDLVGCSCPVQTCFQLAVARGLRASQRCGANQQGHNVGQGLAAAMLCSHHHVSIGPTLPMLTIHWNENQADTNEAKDVLMPSKLARHVALSDEALVLSSGHVVACNGVGTGWYRRRSCSIQLGRHASKQDHVGLGSWSPPSFHPRL